MATITQSAHAPIPRLAYTLTEARKAGGPSRATLYRLERAGKVTLLRGAGRTRIAAEELRRVIGMEARP